LSSDEAGVSTATITLRAQAGWRALRSRSVYFQYKVLVVAVYLAVVIATLLYVTAPRRAGPNDLTARVVVLAGDPIMGRYFVVENKSRHDWLGARFEITGGYQSRRDVVLAGEKLTLYLHDFIRQEAAKPMFRGPLQPAAAPANLPVATLRIESRGRVAVFAVAAPSSP
jgi:hypothetical protein